MFNVERPLIKNSDDIARIREASAVLRGLFAALSKIDFGGVSTEELDFMIEKFILRAKARPSFMTIAGYRHASCISINSEAVHGVPGKKKIIQRNDIVKIDVGVVKNGYFADSCHTFYRGDDPVRISLVNAGRAVLQAGVAVLAPGVSAGSAGFAITRCADSLGYYVHPEFTGHGVGFALHEPPVLLHSGEEGSGIAFESGMVIALEPVVAARPSEMLLSADGWSVYSAQGVPSVQFEHTILITSDGAEVLT